MRRGMKCGVLSTPDVTRRPLLVVDGASMSSTHVWSRNGFSHSLEAPRPLKDHP